MQSISYTRFAKPAGAAVRARGACAPRPQAGPSRAPWPRLSAPARVAFAFLPPSRRRPRAGIARTHARIILTVYSAAAAVRGAPPSASPAGNPAGTCLPWAVRGAPDIVGRGGVPGRTLRNDKGAHAPIRGAPSALARVPRPPQRKVRARARCRRRRPAGLGASGEGAPGGAVVRAPRGGGGHGSVSVGHGRGVSPCRQAGAHNAQRVLRHGQGRGGSGQAPPGASPGASPEAAEGALLLACPVAGKALNVA